ncbi:GMC family oxidoreductase [Rhodocytophaga rosea]|uniref:GMC family oxidoreductase n=1 Tax=Rhodocytophaga rosea TaxID=2704465 RepID=A0A6C0GBM9_9BACT|nr:GMC family oxidoreductase [Rhodocytophaga rosea]QHT65341.1 GMC family oxidoreductase [Rhodocytophaga rosea]
MIYRTDIDFKPENIEAASKKVYDAIIIGGGTSGLLSALTLIENGKKVALFEAGSFSLLTHLTNTELRFQRELTDSVRSSFQYTQKMPDGNNFGPNFSCLGGRGLFWNGASPRFQPHDFDGWQLSYEEMIPYYEWAEKEFRVSDSYGRTDLAQKAINTINEKLDLKAISAPFAFNDSKEYYGMLPSGISSALGIFFRNTFQKDRKELIDIFCNSFVKKINLSITNNATGVIASINKTQLVEFKANIIIVAGGGIESIKLLKNSNVPDPHYRIGKGIQEHLFYRTFWDGSSFFDSSKKDAATIFIPSESQNSEQIEIHAPGRYLFATDNEQSWEPDNRELYHIMIRSFAATEKSDNNFVAFNTDNIGNSIVHFSHSDKDRSMMQKMKSKVSIIGASLNLSIIEERFASFGGSYHEAGGLDMGNDPKTSVTDKAGRVHTCENIYVLDASVFPIIGATNPHLTLAALSRKQTLNICK